MGWESGINPIFSEKEQNEKGYDLSKITYLEETRHEISDVNSIALSKIYTCPSG